MWGFWEGDLRCLLFSSPTVESAADLSGHVYLQLGSDGIAMLCTQQTQEMSPAGRIHLSRHPGKSSMGPNLVKLSNTGEHGLPIVKALGAISLNENCKVGCFCCCCLWLMFLSLQENWEMRSSANGPGGNCEDSCEEELYTKDHTVIWSRIMLDGTSHVIKSFTMDTPVLEVRLPHSASF